MTESETTVSRPLRVWACPDDSYVARTQPTRVAMNMPAAAATKTASISSA
jgi:hypothetical protein